MRVNFTLQLGNAELPILQLSTPKITLSSDVLMLLKVLSSQPLSADNLQKPITISVTDGATTKPFFHGIINEWHTIQQTTDGYHYQLSCLTPWSLLTLKTHTRVFVKKTVHDIAEQLFLQNQCSFSRQWQTQHQHKPLPSYMQYQESDADFLQALLAQQGFIFRFQFEQQNTTLEIVDDVQQFAKGAITELSFPHKKRLQRTDYSVLTAQVTGHYLSSDVEVRNHSRRKPADPLHISNNAVNLVPSHGRRYQYGLHYTERTDGERLQQIRQQALNAQRMPFYIDTDCPYIILGQTLKITDNPNFNETYRVIHIQHHYQTEHALPIPISSKAQTTHAGYRNRLTLIPAAEDYHVPVPQAKQVAMLCGVIEGNDSDKTYIDQNGNYHVRFDGDENQHPAGQASAPISASQISSGANAGLHFPLLPGTRVAIFCINGDVNRPVIAGILNDDKNPNLVTNNNATQHLWQTAAGHQVLMDDAEQNRILRVNTAQQENQLQLQSHGTPSASLSSRKGSLHIQAGKTLLEDSKENHNVNVQGQHSVTVNKHYQATTASDNMNFQAGKNVVLNTAQQMRLNSTSGNHTINSGQNANLQAQQNFSISTGQNIQLRSEQQNIHILGSKGIHFVGELGFSIAQAGGKIILDKDGNLEINAPTINIIGKNILLDSGKLQEGGEGTAANAPVIPPLAKHWIRAQYLDANQQPITNLPYTITTPDGTEHKGMLDASGKTERIAKLTPGTATLKFGDKEKLEQQLAEQRKKLQATLNILLIKVKAQAAKDKAVLLHENWFERDYYYSKAVVISAAKGAWNVAKAIPKGVIDLFADAAKVQALDSEGQYASMTGNMQQLNQVDQQMVQMGDKEFGWIDKTINFIDFLFQDAQTRDILETFAKNYYNSESKLMVSKQIAEALGGFIMAIIAALVTKRVTAFAPEVASSEAFSQLGPEIDDIAGTLKELDKCEEVSGAEVDKEHVVEKSKKYSKHDKITSAQLLQKSSGYNPDEFKLIKLSKGSKLVGGIPGQSSFYTSEDSLLESEYNKTKLFRGLQVEPHPILGYRPMVGIYELQTDIELPTGKALANTVHGEGGLTQYVNEEFLKNLKLIETIKLKD